MGKHFPDRIVLFTLIAGLTAACLLSLAFDRGRDNQDRRHQEQATQVIT